MTESLNAPFWSLHVELYGSFLVLALVAVRMRSRRLHAAAVVALAVVCPAQPLFLFVIGHLAARALQARAPALLGTVLLVAGIGLCADKDWIAVEWLRTQLTRFALVDPPNLYQFASQLGAIAVFAGVLLCPPVRALLATKPLQRLGALSFSIYLLHFPILFTLVSVALVAMAALPYAHAAAIAIAVEIVLTLSAAVLFERWVDRPATALSRRLTPRPAAAAG
jgi:peptidoglycan/LPS O-acetylase OafA/YrhL